MSGAIGPGDWVQPADEAVRAQAGPESRLVLALVPFVVPEGFEGRATPICGTCGPLPADVRGLDLKGLSPPHFHMGWCPNHWKLIYRPKADFLEGLLRPVDAPKELEPA